MTSSSTNALEETYTTNAPTYDQFLLTPLGTLEFQLFHHVFHTLYDLRGLTILDLGGGTGLRARSALAAGASSVDLIDISPSMMRIGQQAYGSSSSASPSSIPPSSSFPSSSVDGNDHQDRIRWFQADVSKPLNHLPLGTYDAVIANGIFDHAASVAELEGMWRNAARYLKPGGWVVANRNNPRSKVAVRTGPAASAPPAPPASPSPSRSPSSTPENTAAAATKSKANAKYGVTFSNFHPFTDGYSYKYRMLTTPPLEFDSMALDIYAGGSLEVPGKFFEEFRTVPWQETQVVRANPEFWREFLEDPILFIFTAKKKKKEEDQVEE